MSSESNIIGHDAVRERLWAALSQGRVHHAYLFEGPEGLGKATFATEFAMAANCAMEEIPCRRCDSCVQIQAGNHPDVWVVRPSESSSTRTISVDQIREVVRKVGYHRFSARRRVVIIDPAEAMTPTAANALLKTLEEPPEGTGFVLVTHQADALLPTIRSRCQRIRFGPVAMTALAGWLENKGVEDAPKIAAFASGCPGRALSLSEGEWQSRVRLRDGFLDMCGSDTGTLFEWSKTLCSGNRQVWEPKVLQLLEITEELLADACKLSSGPNHDVLHIDCTPTLERWVRAGWPIAIAHCSNAILDARKDLARNVPGRLVVEALGSQFQAAFKQR